jgi:16S rRNA (adenine1518-N6/adenine1519-N6)-dimethyltransferase
MKMSKRKTGQNFLINNKIAENEVKKANLNQNDTVLEIGPGKGILTNKIAEQVNHVIAVEIDKNLIKILKDIVPSNVELINADILDIDFNSLTKFNKIVANLPFQISSPVTFKILDYPFEIAILIYQKDFAERMIASFGTKQYSRLSVGVYYKSFCRILDLISRNNFEPMPKVDSCMVEIKPRKNPPFEVSNEDYFFKIVKNLFNHRRKKIKNILKLDSEKYKNVKYLDNRVEELTPKQIGELSNILYYSDFKIDIF